MNIDEPDYRELDGSPRPPKKQKIDKMTTEMRAKLKFGAYARPPQPSPAEPPPPPSNLERAKDSAFNFKPLPNCGLSSQDFMSDITNYIPIGCLRVSKDDLQISQVLWNYQTFWAALTLPKDIFNTRDNPQLYNQIQDVLFRSKVLSEYEMLFTHGFIRLEFKVNNDKIGQLRVYLLHNHLVHQEAAKRRREIEKFTKRLMHDVDISKDTWAGSWSLEVPILHIHPALNQTDLDKVETLLDVYNSLPSPKPCPQNVWDLYSRGCMEMLLKNDVHGLNTILYPYQRASAAAMLEREVSPGRVIDPRLIKLVDQRGEVWYCDPDEGYTNREPRMYEGARGGILAENMGLGKTLICLALILATRDVYSTIPPQFSLGLIPKRPKTGKLLEMAAGALGRHAVPWKTRFAIDEDYGYELTAPRRAIREQPGHYTHAPSTPSRVSRSLRVPPMAILLSTTTLVVVPPNLIQQWLDEIKKHTSGLKVLALASNRDVLPSEVDLLDYDILLFTKTRFEKEGKDIENSPLIKIHFKRLIYDEGHTVGNSSAGSQTDSFRLINALKLTSRWIVSGTPTSGLYSTEESSANTTTSFDAANLSNEESRQGIAYDPKLVNQSSLDQERKDLMKLGNIVKYYLEARPWAPSSDGDNAQWNRYVLQARHGAKSRGSADCLRTTLEAIMIKHRLSDVEKNVVLPKLHQSIVKLEPCLLDKLTLNVFNIMVITNAVASERQDIDYFFHPTQRKSLQSLVSNLREGSFFWSGFEVAHVQSTIDNAQAYLDKENKSATAEDIALLQQVVALGRFIVSNNIFNQICRWHEIPLFVENEFPAHLRRALSLDNSIKTPSLMGATMLFDAQKYVHENPTSISFVDGLIISSQKSFKNATKVSESHTARSGRMQDTRGESKAKTLAGGVTTGMEFTPMKHNRGLAQQSSVASNSQSKNQNTSSLFGPSSASQAKTTNDDLGEGFSPTMPLSNGSNGVDHSTELDAAKFLKSARITSTASAKLSYLLDRIVMHQEAEKILVFYESDNVGWYIAQCLECLGIKHLIYSKGLKSEKRARYVVTFNRTETFRVLLMDVSQAAYGLDMSSASRVYFVNPVFAPQVEAQAVKRAHRIGQVKPVYVETLVLSGSIEEVIVDRRGLISNEEHQKYKSILDDQTVYDWIRNLKLIPMEIKDVPDPDQMAPLSAPPRVFGHGNGAGFDADAEIMEIENYDQMNDYDQMNEPPSPDPNPRQYRHADLRNVDIVVRGARGQNSNTVIVQGLRLFLQWSYEIQEVEVPASPVLRNAEARRDRRERRLRAIQQDAILDIAAATSQPYHPGSYNGSLANTNGDNARAQTLPADVVSIFNRNNPPYDLAALAMAGSGARFYASSPPYPAHVVHGRIIALISDADLAQALANGHTLSVYSPGEDPFPRPGYRSGNQRIDGQLATNEELIRVLFHLDNSDDDLPSNFRSLVSDENLPTTGAYMDFDSGRPSFGTAPAIRPRGVTYTENEWATKQRDYGRHLKARNSRGPAAYEEDGNADSMGIEGLFPHRRSMAMSQPSNETSIFGNPGPSRPMQRPSGEEDVVTGSPILNGMRPAPRPTSEDVGYESSRLSMMLQRPRTEEDVYGNSAQFGSRPRPSAYEEHNHNDDMDGDNILYSTYWGRGDSRPVRSTPQPQNPGLGVERPQKLEEEEENASSDEEEEAGPDMVRASRRPRTREPRSSAAAQRRMELISRSSAGDEQHRTGTRSYSDLHPSPRRPMNPTPRPSAVEGQINSNLQYSVEEEDIYSDDRGITSFYSASNGATPHPPPNPQPQPDY